MNHKKSFPFSTTGPKWRVGRQVSVCQWSFWEAVVWRNQEFTDSHCPLTVTPGKGGRAQHRSWKEVIFCGNFPLSACEPAPGRDAGLQQGSSQEQKMLRMFVRNRARAHTGIWAEAGGSGEGASPATSAPAWPPARPQIAYRHWFALVG